MPKKGNEQGSVLEAPAGADDRILRVPGVLEAIGGTKTTLWRMIRVGTFPAPVRLSEGTVGWRRSDVQRWIAERPAANLRHRRTSTART